MKARWHAVRQVNAGERGAFEIAGIEDDEIGGLAGAVDNKADQPALALGAVRVFGYQGTKTNSPG